MTRSVARTLIRAVAMLLALELAVLAGPGGGERRAVATP